MAGIRDEITRWTRDGASLELIEGAHRWASRIR